MDTLTVACVYKPGGGFSDEYVTRLRDTVAKHCKAPHEFVCLTTKPKIADIQCLPLHGARIGYWNKLALFKRGLFPGPVVYLDLDTMIVSDVTDIFTHPHEFTTAANLRPARCQEDILNSAFMAWDGREDLSYLDRPIDRLTRERYEQGYERWGDQGALNDWLRRPWTPLDRVFPGRYCSYKWHIRRQGSIPKDISIVLFHGKPRPHEVNWKLPNERR